jgi:uncharacterized membrane protein
VNTSDVRDVIPRIGSSLVTAVALALHIFGAVVWVGGMFAIYVCLRPALSIGTEHVRACSDFG